MNFNHIPITHQAAVLPEYIDIMGHMNVMWYMHLFDRATYGFFNLFSFGEGYRFDSGFGSFALEQHIRYLAELKEGETATVRTRALGRGEKVIHFMHFLIRDEDQALSATLEAIALHVDLNARVGVPFPEVITARFDPILEAHKALDWDAPVSGGMRIRGLLL